MSLINLFRAACAANDRRRARDTLQDYCDERVKARLALERVERNAERALREALDLETQRLCTPIFEQRNPVHLGFFVGSAELFGVVTPTPFEVDGGAYFRAAVARRRARKGLKCAA